MAAATPVTVTVLCWWCDVALARAYGFGFVDRFEVIRANVEVLLLLSLVAVAALSMVDYSGRLCVGYYVVLCSEKNRGML